MAVTSTAVLPTGDDDWVWASCCLVTPTQYVVSVNSVALHGHARGRFIGGGEWTGSLGG